jgi:hypothetical protein
MAGPTASYRQHRETIEAPRVDASTFRQGWRIGTRLDGLLADGRITLGEWEAAREYRDAWGRVLQAQGGATDLGTLRSGGNGGQDRLLHVVDLIAKLRAVEGLIGRFPAWLCFVCVVEDRAWAATGRILHREHRTARDWTVMAIRLLAPAWSRAGRRRAVRAVRSERQTTQRPVRAS